MDMFQAAMQSLGLLLTPTYFVFLLAGVGVGMLVGLLPGLSGITGIAILLPLIFGLEPAKAMPLIIGIMAIAVTSDSIPAVLFAVPGTSACAATVLDGYPLAVKGEANRALGAAFFASMLGGLFGAICLGAVLPIAKSLLYLFGAPELFMLCVLGVVMTGALVKGRVLKGLTAGAFGLLLGAVGASAVDELRYTFGQLYLIEGVNIVIVVIGLFAIPELTALFMGGTTISKIPPLGKGMMQGIKDVLHNIPLLIKTSTIGVIIGIIPGLGGSVANWLAYGYAAGSEKNKENFGKGDIRGVIAPEASNNAKEGGSLIPTLFLGIPGSTICVLILAAFLMMGIAPGPELVRTHPEIIYLSIWSLALANVIATGLCLVMVRPLAWLTTVRVYYWVPFVVILVIMGVFQVTQHWGDLLLLLGFVILGWSMKLNGWPRPPLIVGVVLGELCEKYLYRSMGAYGAEFLLRPGVIIIFVVMIVLTLGGTIWNKMGDLFSKGKGQGGEPSEAGRPL